MSVRRSAALLTVFGAVALVGSFAPTPEISFASVTVVERQAAAFERVDPSDPTATPDSHDHGAEGHSNTEVQVEATSGGRMVASNDDAGEFKMIGVNFDEVPTEPVYARAQNADGTWQEWAELEVDPDEGPDDAVNTATPPVWVGEATGWEVSVGAADTDAEVVVVKEELQRVVSESTEVAGANPAPPGGMRSRASWGARPARDVSYGDEVKLAVVHHSVSTNSYSASQVPSIIKGIQIYHQDSNGWDDIGYNFVVDKYGAAWEGRQGGTGSPVIGAHARGFNTNSTGIVVLGDYRGVDPSPAAREAVARVAGWKLLLHGRRPTEVAAIRSGGSNTIPAGTIVNLPRVIGHQNVGSTACPGRIQAYLGSVRSRANDWFNWLRFTGAVVTTAGLPQGDLLSVRHTGAGWIDVKGWALDPRRKGTNNVNVYVGGHRVFTVGAYRRSTDIPAKYEDWGPDHGFAGAFRWAEGTHLVCAEAVAISGGATNSLGCANVKVVK